MSNNKPVANPLVESPEVVALRAQLEAMKLEQEALKAKLATKAPALHLKVSEKGAVSLYGMGRFPVTLYPEQWLTVVAQAEAIKTFVEDNLKSGKLVTKAEKQAMVEAAEVKGKADNVAQYETVFINGKATVQRKAS